MGKFNEFHGDKRKGLRSLDRNVPCLALGGIGRVKGHNMKNNTLPGSPGLWGELHKKSALMKCTLFVFTPLENPAFYGGDVERKCSFLIPACRRQGGRG
jgi:hypothetical protein